MCSSVLSLVCFVSQQRLSIPTLVVAIQKRFGGSLRQIHLTVLAPLFLGVANVLVQATILKT